LFVWDGTANGRLDQWNELQIVATSNAMTDVLNDRVISVLMDEDASKFDRSGKTALEV